MASFEEIKAVKEAAQEQLMSLPNVHAVDIGAKEVAGQKTDELAVIVFVERKISAGDLLPHQLVPPTINAIKTDVIEMALPVPNPPPLAQIAPETLLDKNPCRKTPPDLKAHADDTDYMSILNGGCLLGGCQITTGSTPFTGLGTLGCFAYTNEANPRHFALTCHHVTWPSRGKAHGLSAKTSTFTQNGSSAEATCTLTFTVADNTSPASLFFLQIFVRYKGQQDETIEMLCPTMEQDTPESIAGRVASTINQLKKSGISATSAGAITTLKYDMAQIILPEDSSAYNSPQFYAFDLHLADPDSTLLISVDPDTNSPLTTPVNRWVVTMSGYVSGEHYGVYTSVHPGNHLPSFGCFTPLGKNVSLCTIIDTIITSINTLAPTPCAEKKSCDQNTAKITIKDAQYVQCLITTETRVGQPHNSFPSKCIAGRINCDYIGDVAYASLTADVSFIQLAQGIKYRPTYRPSSLTGELTTTSLITDVEVVTNGQANKGDYQVRKYGRTTYETCGTILRSQMTGLGPVQDSAVKLKNLFHGVYTNGMKIVPRNPASTPFSYPGDSGAAVVSAETQKLVGILSAGSPDGGEIMVPIAQVLDEFKKMTGIDLIIATSNSIDDIITVPSVVHSSLAPDQHSVEALTASPFSLSTVTTRLSEVEAEIAAIPAGKRYVTLFRQHFSEIQRLVNQNRRVATVWQRSGGPQIIQQFIQLIYAPEATLPLEINAQPLAVCFAHIQAILMNFASSQLLTDLQQYGPALSALGGLTYSQILERLETWEEA